MSRHNRRKLTLDDEIKIHFWLKYQLGLSNIGMRIYPPSFFNRPGVKETIISDLKVFVKLKYLQMDSENEEDYEAEYNKTADMLIAIGKGEREGRI